MEAIVEVTAAKPVWLVLKEAGPLAGVRFVTAPSGERNVRRLAVARAADLEGHMPFGLSESTPFILLLLEGQRPRAKAVQTLALLAKRIGRAVDPYVATDVRAVRRIIAAYGRGAEQHLIASAAVQDGFLTVWSCEPKMYRCPVSDIPALARMLPRALASLDVSASGSRIHWSDGDVDMDLDAIRQCSDPDVRKEAEIKYRAEAAGYAHAIRQLRVRHGLRQGQIPGLSEREVRRLERGDVLPHSDTLKKLAKGHGCTLDDYMKKLARLSKRPGNTRLAS
jgi:hypothetical protein